MIVVMVMMVMVVMMTMVVTTVVAVVVKVVEMVTMVVAGSVVVVIHLYVSPPLSLSPFLRAGLSLLVESQLRGVCLKHMHKGNPCPAIAFVWLQRP